MFKSLAEKKQQLDNFRRLKKSVDWVVVHSWDDYVNVYVDCNFEFVKLEIISNVDSYLLEKSIVDCFNKAKQKATEILQTKSKEIFK